MDIKITFEHMEHSDAIAQHVNQKLAKVTDFFKNDEKVDPFYVEVWLKANKQHEHHRVELHLKTRQLSLNAHEECPDMYIAIDAAVDKLVKQVVKEREKNRDKNHKKEDTEKNQFRSDKYKL